MTTGRVKNDDVSRGLRKRTAFLGLTTTLTGVRHKLGVLVKSTGGDLERRGGPRLSSLLNLGVADIHRNRVDLGVDVDHVAVLHQGNGTSNLCFRSDVSDDEPVRAAGRWVESGKSTG